MKNYLTKNEACDALISIRQQQIPFADAVPLLESIRICLIGEENGFSLWGKSVEDTRPLFVSCVPPAEDAPQFDKENYEAYLVSYAKALKIAREGKKG